MFMIFILLKIKNIANIFTTYVITNIALQTIEKVNHSNDSICSL